eukprot:CAMPEP_0194197394 /NCGR_PEP_ID=MMETSP0154-20130528/77178_1 /TAXON_ID=1049557 /ORGANISM="Thalassiothrix antarctica, Strain L6-D1" /LENGTH=75 /DNA_ID=CAMNT_0038922055 /DNA_START=10 /DNA_END=237 /DNA_ORIENTATION=+
MALRRPPTRIELRTEDMEEYDEQKKRLAEKLDNELGDADSLELKGTPHSTSKEEYQNDRKKTVQERIGLTHQDGR